MLSLPSIYEVLYENKSKVNFGLIIQDNYYNQRDDSTIENVINTNAYIQYKINNLTFELNGTIKNQSLSTSLPNLESENYYNTTISYFIQRKKDELLIHPL